MSTGIEAGPAPTAARSAAHERRRHQARAVVGHQHGVRAGARGKAPGARTPRARDRRSRWRRRDRCAPPAAWPNGCRRRGCASSPASGARPRAPRGGDRRAGAGAQQPLRPGSSRPTTAASVAVPPSAATLLAALPAPPGTISVESYSRMSTGASRDTRATRPYTNSSATTSPMTATDRPLSAPTRARSCAESTQRPPSGC